MQLITQLSPNMENVVGVDLKIGNDIIGKIISYDKETGKATFEIDNPNSTTIIDSMLPNDNIGISSRLISNEKINWNITSQGDMRIKITLPIKSSKKSWKFWKK